MDADANTSNDGCKERERDRFCEEGWVQAIVKGNKGQAVTVSGEVAMS